MEKKKPLWFDVIFTAIPVVLPFLWLMLILMYRISGFSSIDWGVAFGVAADIYANLPGDVYLVFFAVFGAVWALVGFVFQTIFGFGYFAVRKLKDFLHNKKIPR